MEIAEFIEETARIEKYFSTDNKTKELSTEERKIWYEELKHMSISRYRQIIREVFRKCKFMPKLADIISIQEELPYAEAKKIQLEKVKCDKCKGIGVIFYEKIYDNGVNKITYTYASRCDCANGLNYAYDGTKIADTRYRSKYYIPTAQQLGV